MWVVVAILPRKMGVGMIVVVMVAALMRMFPVGMLVLFVHVLGLLGFLLLCRLGLLCPFGRRRRLLISPRARDSKGKRVSQNQYLLHHPFRFCAIFRFKAANSSSTADCFFLERLEDLDFRAVLFFGLAPA